MKNKIAFVLLILFCFYASAQPSPLIEKMISTPVTVFDLFVDKLYSEASCSNDFFGIENWENKNDICMRTIEYNYDDNLIVMNFTIRDNNQIMKGFDISNQKEKNNILKKCMTYLSEIVGVQPNENDHTRFGLIQTTDIRHGWGTKDFDDSILKNEIANRTVIYLRTSHNNITYVIKRDQHGVITIE